MQDDNVGKDKESFDHIYNRPDPREYFRVLGSLDYEIPQVANPVFTTVLAARDRRAQLTHDEDSGSVLDVCCSYGVNAALLRCDLNLDDIVHVRPAIRRRPRSADLSWRACTPRDSDRPSPRLKNGDRPRFGS